MTVAKGQRNIFDRVTIMVESNAFPFQKGWPVQTLDEIHSSPIVVNMDSDGSSEIILYASNGFVYVVDHEGNTKPGWPKFLDNSSPFPANQNWLMSSSPAVADFNNDGLLDIIFPL